ncbi:calcineurin B-like protein 1 isoform X1 [Gossypium australe]|uniref:Calcineurin B-like protein n=1 Tax=Gossypium australe TaxID=47621 RepID=A0A5B6VJE3_9ROSI|nr:calcineurin B-like protein 1 isoform X1 [Gossypium australe]
MLHERCLSVLLLHARFSNLVSFICKEVQAVLLRIKIQRLSTAFSIVFYGHHILAFKLALGIAVNNLKLWFSFVYATFQYMQIFDLFDAKKKGVIDFGDFVRALNIFHPNASQEDKTVFAFKLYDMDGTGFIERNEVKLMLIALLCESEMKLGDEIIEAILDKTFLDAEINQAGKIDILE